MKIKRSDNKTGFLERTYDGRKQNKRGIKMKKGEIINKKVKKRGSHMFVVYNENMNEKPIKIWLRSKEDIEDSCLQQANNLSNLPFIFALNLQALIILFGSSLILSNGFPINFIVLFFKSSTLIIPRRFKSLTVAFTMPGIIRSPDLFSFFIWLMPN